MSLLAPENIAVKYYKSTDAGAPVLDKTARCVSNILKACLVTGYGAKEGAGWTMPFEDVASGNRVLRAGAGVHTGFDLRLSGDTGTEMTAQVYLDMTDVNTGDLKLQCAGAFKHSGGTSDKWVVIASAGAVWFFNNNRPPSSPTAKKGSWLFAGNVMSAKTGVSALYLQHTGGGNGGANFVNIFANDSAPSSYSYLEGVALVDGIVVKNIVPTSLVRKATALTNSNYMCDVIFFANNDLFIIPGLFSVTDGAKRDVFSEVSAITNKQGDFVVVSTSSASDDNMFVGVEHWEV